MKKYLVSLVVIFMVCQFMGVSYYSMNMTVNAQGSKFTDVKTTDWYYKSVTTLVNDSREIIQGYGDGTFRPSTELTFEQFVTMVVRACGFTLEEMPGNWSKNYMDKAEALGFLDSYVYTKMSKSAKISREEMAPIIVGAMNYLEGDPKLTRLEEVDQVVMDSSDINNTVKDDVRMVYKMGIIVGYESDHTFRPTKVLNRAEAATVVIRMIDISQREEFDFDALYGAIYGDFADQLLGGANWVDPLNVTLEESAREDWSLLTSDMTYGPNESALNYPYYSIESIDQCSGILAWTETGAKAGYLEDFERLLLRRMPKSDVDYVMDFLSVKKNWNDKFAHKETIIHLTNSNYLVRFSENPIWPNTDRERTMLVNWNIWYRDTQFIEESEDNITIASQGKYIHLITY